MAVAQDIIKRSRRLIGALGRGEVPTNAENVDDLASLNAMLDQLWLQNLAVYRLQEESVSVTAQTHTIGPSGDFVTTRPIKIESAYQRFNSIDYPINIINQAQYRGIAAKSITSTIITDLYYEADDTDGTLYFYPVVTATVFLITRTQLNTFTINETITLPPGYEDMLAFNLAIRLAPEYQRKTPPEVQITAASTLRNIKRLNYQIPQARIDMARGRRYSIDADV